MLTPTAKRIKDRIEEEQNGEGKISVSLNEMSEMVGCSIVTAHRCFSQLIETGFIELYKQGSGRGNNNIYKIVE